MVVVVPDSNNAHAKKCPYHHHRTTYAKNAEDNDITITNNDGKQDKFLIDWRDKALAHRHEYRRLLSDLPTVHDDYSLLVKALVAPLIKKRGKGSASLWRVLQLI